MPITDVPATIRYQFVDVGLPTSLSGAASFHLPFQIAQVKQIPTASTESGLYRSTPVPPPWFATAEKVLRNSTVASEFDDLDGGKWLSREVAAAGIRFLQEAADLLPAEPYFYSSKTGDLVADMVVARGSLTTIVAPTFILLFAVVDGVTQDARRVERAENLRAALQLALRNLTGAHGEVAPSK